MSALWSGHGVHLGTLLGPALLLAFWAGWSDLRAWMHRQGSELAPAVVLLAAIGSIGAGLVHASLAPVHAAEDPIYGAFFALVAAAQLGWAVTVVRRPTMRWLAVGVVGNLLMVLIWAQTRFLTIPVGASAGRSEPVGAVDLLCVAMEAAVAACCLWSASRRPLRTADRLRPDCR